MEKAERKKRHMTAKENRRIVKKTLGFMLKATWKNRPSLFFVYAAFFVGQCLQKVQAVVLPKFLMDELMLVIEGGPVSAHVRNAALYAALICGLNLFSNFLTNLASSVRSVWEEWMNEYFATMLAEHAMKMDFEHTEDPGVLDQMNRAKEGISWYSGGAVGILNCAYDMILHVTVIAGVGAVILFTCPLLLPVQLLALSLMAVFNAKNNRLEMEAYGNLAKSNRLFGYYLFQLSDFSLGKEIRLYNSVGMMKKKAEVFTSEQCVIWRKLAQNQTRWFWGMDIVNAVRDGISYFYIGLLAITKRITVGEFSMCVAAASELYQGMRGVTLAWMDIVKRCNYANQYLKFLEYPAAMEKGSRGTSGKEHTIEFSHVGFCYPRSEQYVLKDINLKIRSGEHLSVVGLNGAGKTTFIKLLCRLYDVTEGAILIDGINIKEYSEEEYRKLFAVVFQDFKLFAFTLRENISFGEKAEDEEINRVLELAGFYEDAQKLPEGLDTMLYKSFDEHGTELSGGQQQKTAIARALYRDAPIVILDEPTAALDPIAEYDIYRRFDCLVGNKTAIYISHRLSSCKFCDRIAVFADNTIKEYGTHNELVEKKNGIYAEMFATQAQYYVEHAS